MDVRGWIGRYGCEGKDVSGWMEGMDVRGWM